MLKSFTLSALVATVLATAASTAFAAPRNSESEPGRAPVSGAEWWQNHGNADEMGTVYRR